MRCTAPSLDLPFYVARVDSAADVLDCGVLQNLNLTSLGIDLDIADMRALLRKRYQIAEVSKNHVYAPPPRFGPPHTGMDHLRASQAITNR